MRYNSGMPQKRSRFKRSSAPNLELTDRDVAILKALERYRFLTVEHLQALTATQSRQGLTRRLRELYDAKFVDRPRAQMLTMAYADKRPMVYALGNEGAQLLSDRFQIRLPDIYWTEKNRRVKEKFVEHTLGVADFLVGMELACRAHGNLRLLTQEDILANAPERTRRKRHPFRWQTRINWGGEWHNISIVPDAVFGLHYTDRPDGKNRAYFMVEIDRGTMPILRRDISQSSFARKLHSYADSYERKLHTELYGIKNFRVLTVTTSQDRIETMQTAYQSEVGTKAPAGMFLFSLKGRLSKDVLDWIDANSKSVDLS